MATDEAVLRSEEEVVMDQFDFSLVRQSGDEQPAQAQVQKREPKDIPDRAQLIDILEARVRRTAENRKS